MCDVEITLKRNGVSDLVRILRFYALEGRLSIGFVEIEDVEVVLALVVTIRDDHKVTVFAREIGVGLFDAHHLLALEGIGLGSAKGGAEHGATQTIVVIGHDVRGIVGATSQEATDMPLDAGHGVEAATK